LQNHIAGKMIKMANKHGHKKPTKPNPRRDAAILAEYTAGMSLENCGKKFDVPPSYVIKMIRECAPHLVRPSNQSKHLIGLKPRKHSTAEEVYEHTKSCYEGMTIKPPTLAQLMGGR